MLKLTCMILFSYHFTSCSDSFFSVSQTSSESASYNYEALIILAIKKHQAVKVDCHRAFDWWVHVFCISFWKQDMTTYDNEFSTDDKTYQLHTKLFVNFPQFVEFCITRFCQVCIILVSPVPCSLQRIGKNSYTVSLP